MHSILKPVALTDQSVSFDNLPARVRNEIKSVDRILYYSSEVTGYCNGLEAFNAEGYWIGNKFQVTSYGSHCYQWDGLSLHNNVKVFA